MTQITQGKFFIYPSCQGYEDLKETTDFSQLPEKIQNLVISYCNSSENFIQVIRFFNTDQFVCEYSLESSLEVSP